jgi:hypothetical protein
MKVQGRDAVTAGSRFNIQHSTLNIQHFAFAHAPGPPASRPAGGAYNRPHTTNGKEHHVTIILPNGLTSAEIRVLQEFRRLGNDRMTGSAVAAIKHPAHGGEAPAHSLVTKGFLTGDPDGFTLTEQGKSFLVYDPKPEFEGGGTDAAAAE